MIGSRLEDMRHDAMIGAIGAARETHKCHVCGLETSDGFLVRVPTGFHVATAWGQRGEISVTSTRDRWTCESHDCLHKAAFSLIDDMFDAVVEDLTARMSAVGANEAADSL